MRLKMTVTLQRDLDDEENDKLIQDLGAIAEVLHFPPECLCISTVQKFGFSIEQCGGIENWAQAVCLRASRCMIRCQTASRVRHLLTNDSLRWLYQDGRTGGHLLVALERAFQKAQIQIQDNIYRSEDVWSLTELACKELGITDHLRWAQLVRTDLDRRFSGWMKRRLTHQMGLVDTRHLNTTLSTIKLSSLGSPRSRGSTSVFRPEAEELFYDGVPRPEQVLAIIQDSSMT